jgi:hypothetical protein
VFPVRYELGFYIPEDAILHSDLSEDRKSVFIRLSPGFEVWPRRSRFRIDTFGTCAVGIADADGLSGLPQSLRQRSSIESSIMV